MSPSTQVAAAAPLPDPLGHATLHLGSAGLVAFPTETVWGLGADARSEASLEALRTFKGRDEGQPISILVSGVEGLSALGFEVTPVVAAIAKVFWPGPLTLVLPHAGGFARGVARTDDGAVGVRCSDHPLAAALVRRLEGEGGGPLTATSLNQSGAPAARTALEARVVCSRTRPGAPTPQLLDVPGAEAGGTPESTVVDLTSRPARVLRWGAVEPAALEPVLLELALT